MFYVLEAKPLSGQGLRSHTLLYARIPRNQQKVRQFGILCPIPQLALTGNHSVNNGSIRGEG